jgi:hypothetical protein
MFRQNKTSINKKRKQWAFFLWIRFEFFHNSSTEIQQDGFILEIQGYASGRGGSAR